MELSLLIIINNSNPFVINLLENLKRIKCEQILMINGVLNIKTIKLIEQYKKGRNDVKVIKSNTLLRYPVAMNILMREVKTKYVFIMDSDILTTEKDLKIIYSFINKNENYGAVQGLLVYPQTNKIQSTGHIFHEYWDSYGKFKGILHNYMKPMERQSLSAGFAMYPTELIKSMNGYDEFYIHNMSGMELSTRIKFNGHDLCCLPTSKGFHFHSLFRSKIKNKSNKEVSRYWATYGGFIKDDLIDEIFKNMYFKDFSSYYVIDCSTISDLSNFLENLKIKKSHFMLKITDLLDNILLHDTLPHTILTSNKNFLWVCTHYDQLINNQLVFRHINRQNDYIIDMSANILPVKKMI